MLAWVLSSEYLPQAKQLADILRQDEGLSITIEGHTTRRRAYLLLSQKIESQQKADTYRIRFLQAICLKYKGR
ncbi:MAG: hypothetical protein CBC55_00880 [Gammaproteobacteria bacterium TMED95]|nr:MAG: hypothetical protein CBC55_00880 [Gammaproteobacteria bacterium TMED95]|tara:strand:- start:8428 stop:8646 length:219 start_codon:yes stop_codon:yes gene_type:complete